MKLHFAVLTALTMLNVQAIDQNPKYAKAREYYRSADFSKAAAVFKALCASNDDADACYWAGLSYEKLADAATPFGCKIDPKAHNYFVRAIKLSPADPAYREALFSFLLNTADCSRTALRKAAAILSATPQSDPERASMVERLETARRLNGSADERLARFFLMLPRATYIARSHASGKTNTCESLGPCSGSSATARATVPGDRSVTGGALR